MLGRPHALVADDHQVNRYVVAAILERLGLSSEAVSNGLEAVEATRRARYDVVLMDCGMPEMNGYEATRQIRNPASGSRNPQVPIIAVTAYVVPGHREKCLECGMDDFVPKPVKPQILARMLAKWLERPELGQMIGSVEVAPAAPGAPSSFDKPSLLRRIGGNERLANLLVGQFVTDAPGELATLKKQIQVGDTSGVRHQAHKIKGAAGNLSADILRGASLEIERAAIAGERARLPELLAAIESAFEDFKLAARH